MMDTFEIKFTRNGDDYNYINRYWIPTEVSAKLNLAALLIEMSQHLYTEAVQFAEKEGAEAMIQTIQKSLEER